MADGTHDRPHPPERPAAPRESPLALRGRILRGAFSNVRFRNALLRDAPSAIARAMGDTGYRILVYQERPREFVLLVPQKTPDLENYLLAVDADFQLFHGAGPTRTQLEGRILKKAFDNPSYYQELRKSPLDVLNRELAPFGGPLPSDVEVKLLIEEPGEVIVLLPSPTISDELTEDELRAVSEAVFPVSAIVAATSTPIGQQVVGSTVSSVVGSVVAVQVAEPEIHRRELPQLESYFDEDNNGDAGPKAEEK